jgi:hypothetical protein
MFSRIGFIAGLRCLKRRSCSRDDRRAARRSAVTTPPSPFRPALFRPARCRRRPHPLAT